MLLLLISFIAGILTVLAPCILPLLPVIVGGSLTDGKVNFRKVLTVVISLGLSIIIFTLLLRVSTVFITIPDFTWKLISGGIILFLGILTLFPSLWEGRILAKINIKSNILLGKGNLKKSFWGDIIVGAALGPVFSTCSPTYFIVLATVLPVSFTLGMIYLLSYTLGLGISLTIIAFLSQKIVQKLDIASNPNGLFKRMLGVLFIIVGLSIIIGFDKKIETKIINFGFFDITKVEQKLLLNQDSNIVDTSTSTLNSNSISIPIVAATSTVMNVKKVENTMMKEKIKYLSLSEKAKKYLKSPELVSPNAFINTNDQSINIAQYIGKKVILLDFWDYSCINCQRVTPYLNAWYDKYKDKGLIIIGVHTPEFAIEKLKANVQGAVNKAGIKYPVVLDNEYKTWNAFSNQFWPNEYLIDVDGYIVHNHAGEGEYDKSEIAIQNALQELSNRLNSTSTITKSIISVSAEKPNGVGSPETYFGANRNEYFGNGNRGIQGKQNLSFTDTQYLNILYLDGIWNILPEYAESQSPSKILFKYNSTNVYFVADNKGKSVKIKVFRDGIPVGEFAGEDIDQKTSEGIIDGERLYRLIHDSKPGVHTIEIQIVDGVLDAYTFTFG